MYIYLYDDMVSMSVDCPLTLEYEYFESAAIFTTLDNSELYYVQFRVGRETNWISCRSCKVIEDVLPTENEILTLLYMPRMRHVLLRRRPCFHMHGWRRSL